MTANLKQLIALGFEASSPVPSTRQYRVRCNNCDATVISGVACHETGCRDAKHQCMGCEEIIPALSRYCENCL